MRADISLPGHLRPWCDEFWQALQGWAASVGQGTAA